MKTRAYRSIAIALVVGAGLSACASGPMTHRERGTLAGAAIGAGTGAAIGAASGDAGEGALIGGAVGAITGLIIGDSIEAQQQRAARDRALAEELQAQDLDARGTDRGVVVNLPDVLFQFGRAELTPGARRKIELIEDVVNGPNASWRRISVEGHTDSIGSEEANLRLSERRAQNVADALWERGVDSNRIEIRGLGEAYPVASNVNGDGSDNPQGRQKNRRVEVVILNEEGGQVGAQPQPIQAPQPQPGYYPAPPPPGGVYYPAPPPGAVYGPPPVYRPAPVYVPGPPPYGY